MNWIEILGPSGIGKTYLKNRLLSQGKDMQLLNLEDALKDLISISAQADKNPGYLNKFLKLYLKQDIIHTKKATIIDILLDYKKAYQSYAHSYSYLLESCMSYYYEQNINAKEKVYRISLFKKIIDKITVFDYYNYSKPIIFDEGPFNHSHQLKIDLVKKENILPKAFIICEAKPKVIYSRVKQRAESGRVVLAHKDLSDKELHQHIEIRYNAYLSRVNEFKKLKVPYIHVDMGGDVEFAIEDIQQFFRENEIIE